MTFIVTGAARSGTAYVSSVLKSLGLLVGHEAVFNPVTFEMWRREQDQGARIGTFRLQTDARQRDGEVSWMAGPLLDMVLPEVTVVHLVRNPLHCIRSLSGRVFATRRRAFLSEYTRIVEYFEHHEIVKPEETHRDTELDRCLRYWVAWAGMVDARADYRLRLEDLRKVRTWTRLMEVLGHSRSASEVREATRTGDYNRGHGGKPLVTWHSFSPELRPVVERAQEMASVFGY